MQMYAQILVISPTLCSPCNGCMLSYVSHFPTLPFPPTRISLSFAGFSQRSFNHFLSIILSTTLSLSARPLLDPASVSARMFFPSDVETRREGDGKLQNGVSWGLKDLARRPTSTIGLYRGKKGCPMSTSCCTSSRDS